jgi:hypothetical protein
MKTSELTGAALDWAVTKCEGFDHEVTPGNEWGVWGWATDWSQGGPIIERERIAVWFHTEYACWCSASLEWMDADVESDVFLEMPDAFRGPTPLIAAMRCYVASQLGDNIDVPKELT